MSKESRLDKVIIFYILFTIFSMLFGFIYSDLTQFSPVGLVWYKAILRILVDLFDIILLFLMLVLCLFPVALFVVIFNGSFWVIKNIIEGETWLSFGDNDDHIINMSVYHFFLLMVLNLYLSIETHSPYLWNLANTFWHYFK